MKKFVLVVFLFCLICLVGCDSKTKEENLIGTWYHLDDTYKYTYVFKEDSYTFTKTKREDGSLIANETGNYRIISESYNSGSSTKYYYYLILSPAGYNSRKYDFEFETSTRVKIGSNTYTLGSV